MRTRSSLRLLGHLVAVGALAAQQGPLFPAPSFSTPYAAHALMLHDLDGDGDLDLASIGLGASFSASWLSVRLGSGDANFAAATVLEFNTELMDLNAGDLNGDGLADLANARLTTTAFEVRFGIGGGAFGSASSVEIGQSQSELELCDWNNDGDLDVLAGAALLSHTSHLLLGNGVGGFGAPLVFPGPPAVADLHVLDIDSDGKRDALIAAPSSFVHFVLGDGSTGASQLIVGPAETYNAYPVRMADFTGTGALDLVARSNFTGSLSLFPGTGIPGSFGSPIALGPFPYALATASLDGDPHADLISAAGVDSAYVYLGAASGMQALGVLPCSLPASDLAVGDVDGDGRVDLAGTRYTEKEVWLVRGLGGGAFELPKLVSTFGAENTWVAAGDIDLDGDPDLVSGRHAWSTLYRLLNGHTYTALPLLMAAGPSDCGVLGDLDGDGKLDLVTGLTSPQVAVVYRGDGAAGFTVLSSAEMQAGPRDIDLADVDQDGDLDVVGTDADTWGQWICIKLTDGTGALTGTINLPEAGTPMRSIAIDLDQDGAVDLATQRTSGACAVRFATGPGGFAPPQLLALPPNATTTQGVAAADFTNDGKLDLAVGLANGDLALFAGAGGQSFAPAQTIPGIKPVAGQDVGALLAADVNLDGRADLVRSIDYSSSAGVFFGGGSSFASTASFNGNGTLTRALALVDFDLDGYPDWVGGSEGYLTISLQRTLPPPGIASFGTGTSSWLGRATLTSAESAHVGDPSFVLAAPNRPASVKTLGMLGTVASPAGFDPFAIGVLLHVDPVGGPWAMFSAATDAGGISAAKLALPPAAGLAGATVHAQLFAFEPIGYQVGASPLHLVSSGGVSITIQP